MITWLPISFIRGKHHRIVPTGLAATNKPKAAGQRENRRGRKRIGASEGIRTLDIHLGKVTLYQAELRSLSEARDKCGNGRPLARGDLGCGRLLNLSLPRLRWGQEAKTPNSKLKAQKKFQEPSSKTPPLSSVCPPGSHFRIPHSDFVRSSAFRRWSGGFSQQSVQAPAWRTRSDRTAASKPQRPSQP